MKHRALLYFASLAITFGLTAGMPPSPPANAQAAGRFYAQTGHTLAPEFISYFDGKGGVPMFGYPLTDQEIEGGLKVQYLERARVEYHPENLGTPYEVQLGLLGSILNAGRQFAPAPPSQASTIAGRLYFPQTNHTLSGPFLAYWQQYGGLSIFGYPISEPFQEGGLLAQYFQRNRFELHPENAGTQYEVLLGLLGRDLLNRRVKVSETVVQIPTYAYEQAFVAPEGDPVGPYPRLDSQKVGPPALRPYRLIVMENRYIKLSVLPQLGGRLYEAIYKPTGHDELYRNPVIKPAPFGERGWWLGAGGMEWAAPTQEHGLMEYLPWTASVTRNVDGGATVTVSATDKLTGMIVSGALTLSPEESAYTVSGRMENPTGVEQRGQMWANTMLAPGGTNHVSPHLRFIIPANEMVVHSTGDRALPAEHEVVTWPDYKGRDLSDVSTWNGWFGAFAPQASLSADFAGVYSPEADEGMVMSFDGPAMPGLKIFGYGPRFDTHVYTDDDSSYVEMWGGITPSFWTNAVFPPNSGLGWSERWQPVAGTGGISLAGDWGTVSLHDGVLSLLPTKLIEGASVVLHRAGGQAETRTFNAYPDKPATVPASGVIESIEVLGADGASLLKGSVQGR